LSCSTIRFGAGVSFAIIFASLLVKCIFLISLNGGVRIQVDSMKNLITFAFRSIFLLFIKGFCKLLSLLAISNKFTWL
jgi:hypothetical protein